ncbi:uncharacterized protein LOC122513004 [Leptopilina heterotoma]|uniref:uncharacterized protein LOC122508892 n=1 Tax=Leptopilina heterotoma TaxID=63436 RepID=UPI001CA7CA82|nr:uncharacterized protein LOC122508892 [Leptopilina heterotoma]XP_043479822.1 uncharacterized protein LOC122509671 [Leptopilina heterotoma]XP_043485166.1 uncharacterized protein LOC122513004 [Leptopilina heterotoma]
MVNKLDPGFEKADTTNLPKLSVFMVYEYITNNERYNAPEVRGVKATLSSRENYGDSAIGYVCVKRQGKICTLKGRICPEHRVRNKNYTVTLKIDEEKEIVDKVECLDCAASLGGCKHGIAFLMWANRKYESPSPTDVECYWRKSALSKVGDSQKFILASELKKKSNDSVEDFGDNSTFLNQVLQQAAAKQLDSQLSRHSFDLEERKVHILSIHQLIFNFIQSEEETSIDNFLKHSKQYFSQDLCSQAEQQTRNQANDILWHELRFGRVTASNIFEASRCKTPEGSLVNRIIGAAKVYNSVEMERGKKLEEKVITEVEKQLKLSINKCGMFLVPSLPMVAASPDGINSEFVVEVKCPSSEKTIENYLKNGQLSQKCKAQINLQMLAAEKKKGLFCVADPKFENNKNFQFVWVKYDENFTNKIIKNSVDFWKQNIFPALLNSFGN